MSKLAYVILRGDSLFGIDLETGHLSPRVKDYSPANRAMRSICFDGPKDMLYAVTAFHLHVINPYDGQIQTSKEKPPASGELESVALAPYGKVYVGSSERELSIFDPVKGVWETTIDLRTNDHEGMRCLTFDFNGALYGVFERTVDHEYDLVQIYPNGGIKVLLDFGRDDIEGLGFCAGQLYAISNDAEVMMINLVARQFSVVWPARPNLDVSALAFRPGPRLLVANNKSDLYQIQPFLKKNWKQGIYSKSVLGDIALYQPTNGDPPILYGASYTDGTQKNSNLVKFNITTPDDQRWVPDVPTPAARQKGLTPAVTVATPSIGAAIHGLVVDSDGEIYAGSSLPGTAGGKLIRLIYNAQNDTIRQEPSGEFGNGFSVAGDLAIDRNGEVFGTFRKSGGVSIYLCHIEIERAQQQLTLTPIGILQGLKNVLGLSFCDDRLYCGNDWGTIAEVNMTTCAVTPIYESKITIYGMTHSPSYTCC